MSNINDYLYPPIEPYASDVIAVDETHRVYFEQSGNPDGEPVLFLHGGPGGGTSPLMRRFFDPDHYRIILFDQRGCGRSTPHACLDNNTTWDLVADIEKLREHLSIERWQLFGGSWGSTLALVYAQSFPERVSAMVLRGIFTLRDRELHWLYQFGASELFPDAWEAFIEPIPAVERHDMIAAYYSRLTSGTREEQLAAARAWSIWEGTISRLISAPEDIDAFSEPEFALAIARIECHYFQARGWLQSDAQILECVAVVRDLPAVIVQGRYDVICPMATAWALHQRWPKAALRVVDAAGHAAVEPGICRELVVATNEFRSLSS